MNCAESSVCFVCVCGCTEASIHECVCVCLCQRQCGDLSRTRTRHNDSAKKKGGEFCENVLTRLSVPLYSCYVSISRRVLCVCQ